MTFITKSFRLRLYRPYLYVQRNHASKNTEDYKKQREYQKCCTILGVSIESTQEEIRRAYIALVKKYHPDSRYKHADAAKFQEIDRAFKILTNKFNDGPCESEEEVDCPDIKHTAPQHRQYLSYDGYGFGTPFQREKQYRRKRAVDATGNILEHRISKHCKQDVLDVSTVKHKIKTKYGFERLVEDLIQEAMSRGEFDNLSCTGKPLAPQQINPYVDYTTQKLNQILIENGYTPEWITLQKEITGEIINIKEKLGKEREYFGPCPLHADDKYEWEMAVSKLEERVADLNKKITRYNLMVPIFDKQFMLFSLRNTARNILETGKCKERGYIILEKESKHDVVLFKKEEDGFFDMIVKIFRKKRD